jgi:choline dehydrogenase-like flavoprotein
MRETATFLSDGERRILVAIAEAALPAGKYLPAAGSHTVAKVEAFLARLPRPALTAFRAGLRAVDAGSWLQHRRGFARLDDAARVEMLDRWRRGGVARRNTIRALTAPLKMAHLDDPGLYKQLGCVYTLQLPKAETKPAYMTQRVHRAADLGGDLAVEADVVVVGTGAGGAVVARELAEAGVAVVLVEDGDYVDRTQFTGRVFEMQQLMYKRGGATFSVGNTFIPIPLGRAVGGSTTVNSGTCFRAPDRVLSAWRDELGLGELGPDGMGKYFDRVESVLQVAPAKAELLGGNARVVARGAAALGLQHHGPLRRNAPDCDGKGVCVFGCPTDAKRSTNVSYVPLALKAGAELFTGCQVQRIIVESGAATGVVARTRGGHKVTIRARAVVIAAGALETPLLLARNNLCGGSGELGRNLSIHPAAGMLAEFDENISAWNGIPQGYCIEDFHAEGILFEGAYTPLELTMSMVQQLGPRLVELAERFDHVASFGFMVEDTSRGSVREALGQPVVTYMLGEGDVARVKRGVDLLAQVFFAAGARRVITPVHGFDELTSPADLDRLRRTTIRASDLDLSAYHPLGTARMGTRPATSVVGPDHQAHDVDRLYVVDGSAVPSSLGVNPQVTIMALATRAAEKIAAALG